VRAGSYEHANRTFRHVCDGAKHSRCLLPFLVDLPDVTKEDGQGDQADQHEHKRKRPAELCPRRFVACDRNSQKRARAVVQGV